jgi:hypothetical protein
MRCLEALVQLVLEQEEVESLLREALRARGMGVAADSIIRVRRNNKKGTLRVAFVSPPSAKAVGAQE